LVRVVHADVLVEGWQVWHGLLELLAFGA